MLIPFIQYPHGSIKWFLESSQGLLLRLPAIKILLMGTLLILLFGQMKRLNPYRWVCWVLVGLLMWNTPHYSLLGFVICFMLIGLRFVKYTQLPETWNNWLTLTPFRFFPACWLLIPQLVLYSSTSVAHRILSAIPQTLFPLSILFGWQWIDLLSHYELVRKDMEQ